MREHIQRQVRNSYVIYSVILSVIAHVLLFLISSHIPFSPSIPAGNREPSRYQQLEDVILKPTPEKPELRKPKAVLVPVGEKTKTLEAPPLKPPVIREEEEGAAAGNDGEKRALHLPEAPALPDILRIRGDRLPEEKLRYNRIIIPEISGGGSGSELRTTKRPGEDNDPSIPLKMRISLPKKTEPPPPETPETRILPARPASVLDKYMTVNLKKYSEQDGSGFFRIDIKPRPDASNLYPFEKDMAFCLDASGSISPAKFNEFKQGILRAIQLAGRKDRFEIIAFSYDAKPLFGGFRNPDPENVSLADDFLFKLQRSGSTNIYRALKLLFTERYSEDDERRPLLVFLISDGKVNTGKIPDSRDVLNTFSNANQNRMSVFTFNSGKQGNEFLLDLLAYRNRGVSLRAEEEIRSRRVLNDFIDKVSDIVVSDIEYQVPEDLAEMCFPKKLPHLYRDQTLSVYGRYMPGTEKVGLRILGIDNAGTRQELVFAQSLKDADDAGPELPRKWALQYIYHLYSRLSVSYDPELRNQIRSIARRYRIETPYYDRYLLKSRNYVSP